MGRAKKIVYVNGHWYVDDGAGGREDVTPSGGGGGGDLDDLDNVDTSGKSNGDILQWNSSSGKWEDAPPGTPSAHASTHENGGADEISLAGLDGEPTALTTHKSSSDHDGRYYTETEVDTLLSNKSDTSHTHDSRYYTETEVDTLLSNKADSSHNHDSRYYTESEIDSQMSNKADTSHTHDDRYYTESETDNLLSGKSDTEHTHTESDITDLDHYTTSDFNTDFASQDLGNLGTKNHSDLNDDEPAKHRLINDSGTGTTDLWSANKISSELSTKADAPVPALFVDNGGNQSLTSGPVTIQLDTTAVSATYASLSTFEITFSEEGTYMIGHKLIYDITDTAGGTRGQVEGWLELDTGGGYSEITGSRAGVYHREAAGGSGLSCPMIPVSIGNGNKIRYRAGVTYSNTNVDTRAGTPIVTIMKIS